MNNLPPKTIHVVAALIFRVAPENSSQKQILATQRGYGKFKGGWEFPGGKIEAGEKPENALVREIQEELNAKILVKNFVHTIEYDYPNFHLSMKCFECELSENQEITLLEHQNAKWLDKKNLYSVDWLPADVDVLKKVEKLL
ncbi:MAG: (deoxy)nucleoside triphosphate pyrophosphohydrolase [Treponemataceae bacterium]|nr:(deoxy)nucleoside triphosphate pyrophosphohydrolase [Treponemataceae bacterium]